MKIVFHLLVSRAMEPVPETIEVLENYGDLQLSSMGCPPEMYYDGKHMVVEGTEQAVQDWLGSFDGVWIGNGPPIIQQFQIMHIGEI